MVVAVGLGAGGEWEAGIAEEGAWVGGWVGRGCGSICCASSPPTTSYGFVKGRRCRFSFCLFVCVCVCGSQPVVSSVFFLVLFLLLSRPPAIVPDPPLACSVRQRAVRRERSEEGGAPSSMSVSYHTKHQI